MIPRGAVTGAHGGLVEARLPGARVGAGVTIAVTPPLDGRVCALDAGRVLIAAHGAVSGIGCGTPVCGNAGAQRMPLGICALGRAIDACGRPLDGGPPLRGGHAALDLAPLPPDFRTPIARPFWTGVPVVDVLLTFGRGARVGIFGAPGAGKSTLLESIVRASADAVVVALAGERGREAQRWIEGRSACETIVCATSDRSAAERVRAAQVAAAQAAALRARGLHVLLVLDSLARVAAALREIAVAAGESPGRGGFPPSVFADLAKLVESAGAVAAGSTTLVATVLDDGDERDPVSDAARSLLDGHVVLSRRLADAGRFPAIDVLASASRTMAQVAAPEHLAAAAVLRGALALLEQTAEARSIGIEPADPAARRAVGLEPRIEAFLRGPNADRLETLARACALAADLEVR